MNTSYTPAVLAATALVLASAALPGAAPAFAEPDEVRYLQSFAGEWRGQGMFRPTPRANAESVICRARGEVADTARVEISGRCGGESFTGTFRITATYDASSGAYQAVFAGPPTIGTSQMIGYRSGNRLELELRHPGQPLSFLQISSDADGRFRITADTTTGPTTEPYTSADIALTRQ